MELTETIQSINRQLIDLFGLDTMTGLPMWRVVWSEDETEKKKMDYSPAGIQLLQPQVFEVPKYPYIKERYILERLVIIPEINQDELPTSKLSYEPMWTFQNEKEGYLPPTLPACKFIVDTIYAALGKSSMAKYKDSEKNTTEEGRQERIKELEDELFGDQSGLYGKTTTGAHEGIVVPNSYHTKES